MPAKFDHGIMALWKERVQDKFIYRGMGMHDIQDGLDPGKDPFRDIRPQLFRLISVLEEVMSRGFRFTVHEDHSGMSFSLNDIIAWTRRDLENPGLDFTSSTYVRFLNTPQNMHRRIRNGTDILLT